VLWKGTTPAPRRWNKPACRAPRVSGVGKQPFAVRQAIVEKFAGLLEANKAELTRIIV
jgi:succinylglutamic semialdehyde dehydrogenase